MKFKNPFRKKNKYASPYYGSNGALFNSSAVPLRLEQQPEQEAKQKIKASQLPPPPDPRPTEPDWEQRRFELCARNGAASSSASCRRHPSRSQTTHECKRMRSSRS